jgi:phosphoribosylformylglycinamidine synthase PurS subunit
MIRAPAGTGPGRESFQMMQARVYVKPKKGVLDPQGKAVGSALHSLGYGEVQDIRVGRYFEVRLEAASPEAAARLEEMCRRLLANPLIEDYRFEIVEG